MDRFEIVKTERLSAIAGASILRDKQTGVHYLFYKAGYAGGLTPLLDREGEPV